MKIGILSDTHDNLRNIDKAVNFLNRHKVNFVLHAGDFVAPFTIRHLQKLTCEWRGVLGNNDGERHGLLKASQGAIKEGPVRMTIEKLRITLVHDIHSLCLNKERSDVVIFGHTHVQEIREEKGKLLINPGECCGWLTGKATVAILDTEKKQAFPYTLP
jgi:putative phosphoesterase